MKPEECLVLYGEAWFERDDARRVEALRRCCTEDILFVDSGLGRLHGLQEVSDMIGKYTSMMAGDAPATASEGRERGRTGSGVSVEVTTGIDQLHRFFRYSFIWTLPDGTRMGGTDFGEFAEDGRMSLITVFPHNEEFPVKGL